MPVHISYGSLQARYCFNITDGAEQAHDDVKFTTQLKIHHVALLKPNFGILLPGNRQHLWVDIQAFHLIMFAEQICMDTRSAAYIKQSIAL